MKELIVGTVSFCVLFLVLAFSFAPIANVLDRWNGYWDGSSHQQATIVDPKWKAESAAYVDCETRTKKYFGSPEVSTHASSTSDDYSTYDCYGVKFTKIPATN